MAWTFQSPFEVFRALALLWRHVIRTIIQCCTYSGSLTDRDGQTYAESALAHPKGFIRSGIVSRCNNVYVRPSCYLLICGKDFWKLEEQTLRWSLRVPLRKHNFEAQVVMPLEVFGTHRSPGTHTTFEDPWCVKISGHYQIADVVLALREKTEQRYYL